MSFLVLKRCLEGRKGHKRRKEHKSTLCVSDCRFLKEWLNSWEVNDKKNFNNSGVLLIAGFDGWQRLLDPALCNDEGC
jgi:hypothetical protein